MSVNNEANDDLIPYRFNDDLDDLEDIAPCNEVTDISENSYPQKVVFLLGFYISVSAISFFQHANLSKWLEISVNDPEKRNSNVKDAHIVYCIETR